MRLLLLLSVLALPGLALAQTTPPKAPVGPPVQIIDITEADLLEAGIKSPEAQPILARPPTRFGSLIELRMDFQAELLASVAEL